MKLLTKELEKRLPRLYATSDARPETVMIQVKFFNPMGQGTWYATEYDPDERIFFGYAEIHPGCGELGYFSLDELQSVKLPFGMGIERDIYFGKHYLNEVIEGKRP